MEAIAPLKKNLKTPQTNTKITTWVAMMSQHVSVVTSPLLCTYTNIFAYVTRILRPSTQSRAGTHPFNKLK